MTKKLMLMALVAMLATNVNAESKITNVEFEQAIAKVKKLVATAKQAGLNQDDTVTIVAKQLETNALAGTSKLSPKAKKALKYILIGAVAGVVGTLATQKALEYFKNKQNEDESEKKESSSDDVDDIEKFKDKIPEEFRGLGNGAKMRAKIEALLRKSESEKIDHSAFD